MHAMLRALTTAAALAGSQSSLTVTENGTYLAVVELDSVPVSLLVDTTTSGLWVKCAALEGATCADGITWTTSGYTRTLFDRVDKTVPVKTKRFAQVKIAGQTFNGFDATVVYHTLPDLHPSIQGVLGLRRKSPIGVTASMYLDNQVTGVMLQLGPTSADSKIGFDTKDEALLTQKGTQTAAEVSQRTSCFRIPLATNSSSTSAAEACSSTDTTIHFDPASPTIGLIPALVGILERRFLYTCSKEMRGRYHTRHYVCSDSVKLPVLTVTMGSWNFTIDPADYTVPATTTTTTSTNSSGNQVRVLVGDTDQIYSGIALGAPFLRKYPVFLNASNGMVTVYCTENVTCTKTPGKTLGRSTISGPGTGGGEGGDGGGGGGTSSGESRSRRNKKKNKIYVGVGLGVGFLLLLVLIAVCLKACQSNARENVEMNDAAKSPEIDEIEFPIAAYADHTSNKNGTKRVSCRCKQREQRVATAAAIAKSRNERYPRSTQDRFAKGVDIDIDDCESSDDDDERRRRRGLRRERRPLENTTQHAALPPRGGGQLQLAAPHDVRDYYYIQTSSPRSKM